VKFMEALKLVHFQVSPCIFFLHFQLTLAFWLRLEFWSNLGWKPWVLVILQITLLFQKKLTWLVLIWIFTKSSYFVNHELNSISKKKIV
jgi:hypothetical protein